MLNILPLSKFYNIDSNLFDEEGILNPILNMDVPLFIDPLLLKFSSFNIFKNEAFNLYKAFFERLYTDILSLIGVKEEKIYIKAKNNLIQKLQFKEINGLCLGYAFKNNKGRGIGKKIAKQILDRAIELIERGAKDSNIFNILFLLEENIGADFISDMTANIIYEPLCKFTEDKSIRLNIPTKKFGNFNLPEHPLENGKPILLLPLDILSELPLEDDTKNVFNMFIQREGNFDIHKIAINQDISDILSYCAEKKSGKKELKQNLGNYVYDNISVVKEISDFINNYNISAYNFNNDPIGVNSIKNFLNFIEQNPKIIPNYNTKKNEDILELIDDIINSFKNFIDNDNETKRNLLYNNKKPKNEKCWQSIFKVYVNKIIEKSDLDLTPEAWTGNGPVDFKISSGNNLRILIEMKLSPSPHYLTGLTKQLEIYKSSLKNIKKSYYMIINLEDDDKFVNKLKKLYNKKNELKLDTEIVSIDGKIYDSASNRR